MMDSSAERTEPLDVLSTTATDLQQLLQDGKTTSVQIVETYQRQIQRYNLKLRAMISIAPNLKALAQALDNERKEGKLLGPLHGIPIIVKVRNFQDDA
jgi:amidase